MAEPVSVRVEGLSEFRKGLRSLRDGAQRELRAVLKAAVQVAEDHARREYRARYGGRGRTVNRIRAVATQSSAGVAFGGAKYPYAPGQEFGSNKWPQFRPWSGPGPGGAGSQGHFIYPAVRAQAEPVARDLEKRLEALARRTAYPEP